MAVCLCMIVKNEAKVILRCLDSVAPHIANYIICDTGSSDGTQGIISHFFNAKGIPGKVIDRPWVDFSHNRNEALSYARESFPESNYLLMMDADDTLMGNSKDLFQNLTLDAYEFMFHLGLIVYPRISLIAARQPWRYKYVLHEVLCLDPPYTCEVLRDCYVQARSEGSRSSDPQKFLKDAQILRDALQKDPTESRYQFYLAQSLKDANQPEEAIQEYQKRCEMGGWQEEVWYSKYQMAQLAATLPSSYQPYDVVKLYLEAIDYRPSRAETYGRLATHLRLMKRYATACLFAYQGMQLPSSQDKLFIEQGYYDWKCEDEFAVSAYWCGRYQEAFEANERLLTSPLLPDTARARIQSNLNFCKAKLGY